MESAASHGASQDQIGTTSEGTLDSSTPAMDGSVPTAAAEASPPHAPMEADLHRMPAVDGHGAPASGYAAPTALVTPSYTSSSPAHAPLPEGVDGAALEREIAEAMSGLDMNAVAASADSAPAERAFAQGDLVAGSVISCTMREVLVDLGGKAQGVVPRDEFVPGYEPPAGTQFNLLVDSVDGDTGLVKLSKKRADTEWLWQNLKIGDVVEGIVSGMNKGGLELAVKGIRAFIPSSQVDLHFVKDVTELFGKTVRAEVMKIDRADQNLVVSRRKVLEREVEEGREKFMAELAVGQTRKGKVRSVADFGAFVELQPGIDGLIHVSDMSYGRVNKASDVLKVDDEVEVMVLKVNKGTGKISLGLKQLKVDPWTTAAERYEAGALLTGRVARIVDFGVFVELEPGIDGLVPLIELSWSRAVRHPKEVVREGDMVQVRILKADIENQRISLSLKQVEGDPWAAAAEKYALGAKVTAKVVRLAQFGAFVELSPGVDAMIHISELSDKHVKSVADVVKEGQEIEARVIRIDPANHKIGLSMKPEPDPAILEAQRKEAEEEAKRVAKKKAAPPRRGGIDISWDQGFAKLDPTKYAR